MSDYTQLNDFGAKDLLATGDPNKLILGADIDAELTAITAAILSKYDNTDLASQAEAEAGASGSKLMTPQRTEQWGANWADENAGMVGDIHALTDPNADRILFWDDSAGAASLLTVSTGLTLSGSNLTVNNSALSITESQISNLGDTILLNSDIGNSVQAYDADTTKNDVANTFTDIQTITRPGASSDLVLDAVTGRNSSLWLKENSVKSFLVRNSSSIDSGLIAKYDAAGTAEVSCLSFDESGNVDLTTGTLKYDGAEVVSTSNTLTLTNKTLTSPVINTSISGTAFLDEDDMASNSATKFCSQQSIKAYVDNTRPGTRGALVRDSDGQTISDSTMTTINWNNEEYDTDSIHSTVTNDTRLTVPSGVSRVRVAALITWVQNSTGSRNVTLWKNGAVFVGGGARQIGANSSAATIMEASSAPVEVTPGDYFEVAVYQTSGSSLGIASGGTNSWFAMEIIE